MRTYFSDIIPKFKKYSQKLDDVTLLTNQHWLIFNENSSKRVVYIFRDNNELLISKNGKVEKGSWEYLGNSSLLIDQGNSSFLFNHGFLNEKILALKTDGENEYAILLNEQKIQREISTLEDVTELLKKSSQREYLPNEKQESKNRPKQHLSESAQKIADSDVSYDYNMLGLWVVIILVAYLLYFIVSSS
ncbi:hypothetical protein [Fodinibius sp. Rm-B-1B1-1]|uniref:hypothetical protein n=1 Tax=Fodinibius alkaliphilus TaxID=3140241 RepID=UPI00315ACBF1